MKRARRQLERQLGASSNGAPEPTTPDAIPVSVDEAPIAVASVDSVKSVDAVDAADAAAERERARALAAVAALEQLLTAVHVARAQRCA